MQQILEVMAESGWKPTGPMNAPPDPPNRDATLPRVPITDDQVAGFLRSMLSFAPPSSVISRPSTPVTETAGWPCSPTTASSRTLPDRHPEQAGRPCCILGPDPRRHATRLPNVCVRMVQGPLVCGLEAAWAFELRIAHGERIVVVEIIDQAVFTERD